MEQAQISLCLLFDSVTKSGKNSWSQQVRILKGMGSKTKSGNALAGGEFATVCLWCFHGVIILWWNPEMDTSVHTQRSDRLQIHQRG